MGDLLIYVLLGLSIGIISGFFGIGGGFVLTPILILMSFSPLVAIATSLLYTVATSCSGVVAHFRLKHIKWKIAIILGVSGVVGTQIAHPFVLFLDNHELENTVIPFMYLGLTIYFPISILRSRDGSIEQPVGSEQISYIRVILIGLMAGFVSTTLGVGGGFIIVPLLISLLRLQPKFAVGTSLLSVFIIGFSGFASYASSIQLNYGISGSLIIGALVGGQLGATLTKGYGDTQVRQLLAGLYIATGISLAFKLIHIDVAGLIVLLMYCLYMLVHFVHHSLKLRMKEKEAS